MVFSVWKFEIPEKDDRGPRGVGQMFSRKALTYSTSPQNFSSKCYHGRILWKFKNWPFLRKLDFKSIVYRKRLELGPSYFGWESFSWNPTYVQSFSQFWDIDAELWLSSYGIVVYSFQTIFLRQDDHHFSNSIHRIVFATIFLSPD